MTEQKHKKALIRARMARTGESYTAARRHIVAQDGAPSLEPAGEFRAHDKHCMTALFLPDGRHIVSGGFGGQARIWELDGSMVGELIGHEASVNVVRVSDDGGTAVTAASDRTVRIWDVPARRERAQLGRHKRQLMALDLDAGRDRAWVGTYQGSLQAWRLSDQELETSTELRGRVTSIAVRGADGLVAAATVGAGISVRDASGQEVARLAEDAEVVGALAWAADGAFLLGSAPDGATLWAAHDWEPVRSLAIGRGGMLPVALSEDGSRIAVGWDNHIGLWSADEEHPPALVDGLPKGVYGLAFSPDGRLLAMAAADGRVRTYRVT